MPQSLYIIDGHAQIYAAYYAPMSTSLTAPGGEPTKATYIFTTMLLKLLREKKPDLIAVAMDAPGRNFRHELFPEYKATRQAMPEDLPVQIQRIEEICHAFQIPVLRRTGYEADDLIGTLTRLGRDAGYDIVICSRDKDLEQLLQKHVRMYDPRTDKLQTPQSLQEEKGITPEQVIDVLTLMGDKVDNVPGVPGVGPKTALQWIQQYGSLDELIKNTDQIKGKRGNDLRNSLEQLKLSKKLIELDNHIPLEPDWQEFTRKEFDPDKLTEIFHMLGFHKLIQQLQLGDSPSVGQTSNLSIKASAKLSFELIDTPETFELFFTQLKRQKQFAVDTETTGLNPVAVELVGMSFAWKQGQGYYLPLRAPMGLKTLDRDKTLTKLKPILEDPKVHKIGQNIKYDQIVFRKAGIILAGIDFDTMIASYLLDSQRTSHGMDRLALDILGHETLKLEQLIGKGKNQLTFDEVDTTLAAEYAAEDAEVTYRLAEVFRPQLENQNLHKLFSDVEMPLVDVLAEIEYQGVAVDVPWLKKLGTQFSNRLEELTEQIHEHAGCTFNVDSPKQLSEVLFDRIGLTPVKKTKTGSSTDQEVLETLAPLHPVPALMLEYRQLSKLKNTYVDTLPTMIYPATGRIHTSFNQTVAATGRLSSSNPNLQNIPIRSDLGKQIRRAFIAQKPENILLSADYSQIELRLLAHFSQDRALLAAFDSGQDIHRFVASQVYQIAPEEVTSEQRSKAKAVNFGIIYGQTAYGLSRGTGMTMDEAQQFINDYFDRYGSIHQFMEQTVKQAEKTGFVQTILGRRRGIPEAKSQNQNLKNLGRRLAVNTVVQGSAADLIKVAMIHIHQKIKDDSLPLKMILQVHDELVFELNEKDLNNFQEIIRQEMEQALPLQVPIRVDIASGKNWLDCKP